MHTTFIFVVFFIITKSLLIYTQCDYRWYGTAPVCEGSCPCTGNCVMVYR